MPFRIDDYSETISSPAKRDFAKLNLLICGNFARGGQDLKIAQLRSNIKNINPILCEISLGVHYKFMIDPSSLAFDIDGVLADTMTLFLDIAREEYKIRNVKYEDITCYTLEECVDIDPVLIEAILTRIMDGTYKASLKPMPGARNVLTRIGRRHNPILFVTARSTSEPIHEWIQSALSFEPDSIEVVATGSFDAKVDVLSNRNISYFVEDRLETCYPLFEAGVTPIIFKQPWNRKRHPFVEVDTWKELESLIKF